ncbi:hypothetical protein V2J09_011912 [Rumex salicifolius]
MVLVHHPWVFAFGLLGNVISFLVYIAPLPTFWRIYKKKSTEGFQSLPYVCAIFSSMLWIYYALLKSNSLLLITINSFGCVIETIYIAVFLAYAPKQAKSASHQYSSFAAILQEKRLGLSFWDGFVWRFRSFSTKYNQNGDPYKERRVHAIPSVVFTHHKCSNVVHVRTPSKRFVRYGFTFGVAQMVLYGIYRNQSKIEPSIDLEMKFPAKITCANNVGQELSPATANEAAEAVTVVVAEVRENGDDINVESPREVHVTPPSSCGVDEIMIAGPAPAGAIPLVNCVV